MPGNDSIFDGSDYETWAKHFRWATAGGGKYCGGITPDSIEEGKIYKNTVIYRIGHSNKSHEYNMSSPWWFTNDSIMQMRGCSMSASGDEFQKLYRLQAAVSNTFGVANLVYAAYVTTTLRCFSGKGSPVIDDRDRRTDGSIIKYPGCDMICQNYIPGLRTADNTGASADCRKWLECYGIWPIHLFARYGTKRSLTSQKIPY